MEEKVWRGKSKLVEEGYKPLSVPGGATWSHIFSPISTIQVQPFHMGGWVQPHEVSSTMSFLKVCDLIGHPNG
jgi:hypothetical protein